MHQTIWVVCYDVVDDRRRTRIMKKLEGYGKRVQYSVFECELDNGRFKSLYEQLNTLIHEIEDSVRFYPLYELNTKAVKTLGKGSFEKLPGHIFLDHTIPPPRKPDDPF